MNDTFNPMDWIESTQPEKQESSNHPTLQPSDISTEVELVISRIESSLTDITTSYPDWLNVGFAFANEFGEGGRSFFHRVSRFYAGYTKADCDKQYDRCLKATPSSRSITIKTFFHLARQAGMDVKMQENGDGRRENGDGRTENGRGETENEEGRSENDVPVLGFPFPVSGFPSPVLGFPSPFSGLPSLPTLPDSIFPLLPEFLQKVVEGADTNEERDIMLLGALGVLSACFPKLSGIYDSKKVFSNLYLFVTSPASAGKGRLSFCKQLVNPIHWELRKECQRLDQVYDMEMREYNIAKTKDSNAEKPDKPPQLMFYIPANSTATGMYQLMSDNEDRGLIFETEGDTLALAFKSDHGNYSDAFRKGAHHEMISYYRRTDREYREIKHPCISAVLSGTPKQVSALIPSAENGLFSRFIFYYMNIRPVWKDVFAKRAGMGLEEHFDLLGQDFFSFFETLKGQPDMRFCLTEEQQQQFNEFFTQIQDKYITFHGMDYMGTIRRMGLIAFRIAMIFTGLRIMESGDFSEMQVCSDEDFQSALSMVRILIKHSSHVFSELPADVKITRPKDRKEQFFDKLPEKFTRPDYIELAKDLSIAAKTADRYIAVFCEKGLIFREQHGSYINLSLGDKED